MDGNTPLHLAAARGFLDAVQLLLRVTNKSSASLTKANYEGQTAISLAEDGGFEGIIKLLRRKTSKSSVERDFVEQQSIYEERHETTGNIPLYYENNVTNDYHGPPPRANVNFVTIQGHRYDQSQIY